MRIYFPAFGTDLTLEQAFKFFAYLNKLKAPMRFIPWSDLDLVEKKSVLDYCGITHTEEDKHVTITQSLDDFFRRHNPKITFRTDNGYTVIFVSGKVIFQRYDKTLLFLRKGALTEKSLPEYFKCQK